jgi:hypothetical protein
MFALSTRDGILRLPAIARVRLDTMTNRRVWIAKARVQPTSHSP